VAPSTGAFEGRLAPDAGGARFRCDLSDQIAKEAFFSGLYEPPVTRVVQRRTRAGAIMVDVGANWGYFTLVAAASVGPRGRVIAFEPDPRMCAALDANVRLNRFQQVTPVLAAAGPSEGTLTLAGYEDGAANRGVSRIVEGRPAAGPAFDVRATTVDAATADLASVDLVKIDVEGFEDAVLAGMKHGLASRRYRAIVLELHPDRLRERGVDPEVCIQRLRDAGYTGRTIDGSASTYRRAANPAVTLSSLLKPLDAWRDTPWPHLLWQNSSSDESPSIHSSAVL